MPSSQATQSYRRRYVGGRESMSYVLYSSSLTFHINEFQTRFVVDVLKIDLGWNSVISFINGVWDVVNDGLLGALVDRTHTRWGKFRPYLLFHATLGTVFTTLYWLTPLLFDKNPQNIGKAVFWLALSMLLEAFGTAREISEAGLTSCMSPNPEDRVRMFEKAQVIASIWENIPGVVMGLMIDLVNHQRASFSMETAYVSMGSLTMVTGGVLALFFCLYARERVAQARERHSYREGLRTILRNKPLLLILLSDFLGGFSVETWEHNYYIDVLGAESYRNLVVLPGAPVSFLSYAYINKIRERVSVKWLWIVGSHVKHVISLGVFALGSVGGLYQKVLPMLGLLIFRDICYKSLLSVAKIIPREITLDAVDYAEWHSGFRSEGTILTTKSMTAKIVRNAVNSLTTFIMKQTGYSLHAGFGQQSQRAKYALFAMSFGIPAAIGLLGMVPKFFYDLTGEKRERMYAELAEMRKLRQAQYDVIEN